MCVPSQREIEEGNGDLSEKVMAAHRGYIVENIAVLRFLEPVIEHIDVAHLDPQGCKKLLILLVLEVAGLQFLVYGTADLLILLLNDKEDLGTQHENSSVRFKPL